MEYSAFLLFLNQISNQRKAKVVIQGSVIFIEKSCHTDYWSISTKVVGSHIKQLNGVLGSYLSRGSLRWQGRGAYLKVDEETESVYLVQEVLSSKKYIPFKSLINDFASVALEWKEIFEDGSDEESLIFRCI
jgi:hypothetical protein